MKRLAMMASFAILMSGFATTASAMTNCPYAHSVNDVHQASTPAAQAAAAARTASLLNGTSAPTRPAVINGGGTTS